MNKLLQNSLVLLVLYAPFFFNNAYATQLSGIYTINGAQAATTSNFRDFSSAITFLSGSGSRADGGPSNTAPFGVSAAVRFMVAAGTYNEQVTLDGRTIPGISAVNTLTFDGGLAAPQLVANVPGGVVLLKQCTYITLRNLSIVNNNRVDPAGIVIHGNSTAQNNGTGCKVKQCTISLFNKEHYQSVAICLTDSDEANLWSKTWADSVEIDSNIITGAAFGIYVSGGADTLRNRHIKVRNNNISGVHFGALIYAVCNGLDFLNNYIDNTGDETPVITVEDMVRFYQCNNTGPYSHRIIGNRLNADLSALAFEYSSGVSTAPVQIYNNMIRARMGGIKLVHSLNQPNYYNVYHNTVYVMCRIASRYFGGTPLTYYVQGHQYGLKCRNNIFAVEGTGPYNLSVAASIGDTTSMVNNNVYYNPYGLGGRIISRKDSIYYTSLTNVLVPALGGDSSVISKPVFIPGDDLLLANGCQLRGTDLGADVPTDINGKPRPANPMAGCHEFSSQPLDLTLESITAPAFPASPGLHDLNVLVRNAGTTPVTMFKVSYELNGNLVSKMSYGFLNPCDTTTVTFDNSDQIYVDSIIALKLKVYVSEPNGGTDLDRTNDTLMVSPLQGTYTIGGAFADYATFDDALKALYVHGMSGNVTLQVNPGTYPAVKVLGSNINGLSSASRLTFESAHGPDSVRITDNLSGGVVTIQNARYVTFRGFTIENQNSTTGSGVAIIGNMLAEQFNGSNCAVKQCRIKTTGAQSVGIIATGDIDGYTQTSIPADSIQFDSNTISSGLHGIMFQSVSNTSSGKGNVIRNNSISNFSGSAIRLANTHNGFDIFDNHITGSVSCHSGISIAGFINPGISTMRVHRNKIEAPALYGMYLAGCWALNSAIPFEIYNNSVVNSVNGILFNTFPATQNPPATYVNLLHNSVNVNVTQSTAGYAFVFGNANTPGGGLIQNNIFAVTAASGISIPVSCQTPFGTTGSIDNNNYYNTNGPGLIYRGGMFTQADFKTAAAGGDSSLNITTPWVSASDLHLTAGCRLKGLNTSPLIVTDLEGNIRGVRPNMGSYEFIPPSNDLAIEAITAPAYPVVKGMQDVKVRLLNNGASTITSAEITCVLNSASPLIYQWTGTLKQCEETILTFANMQIDDSNFVSIYLSAVNTITDDRPANDTIKTMIRSCMSGDYTIGASPADYPSFSAANADMRVRGISGHVVFYVKSGVYNEKVEFTGYIEGVTDSSTITFRSLAANPDSVKLQYAGSTASNYIVRFNNASHFTFKNISLVALDSSYARVVEFAGASSYITIDSCILLSSYYSPMGLLSQDRIAIYAPSLSGHHNIITHNLIRNSHIGIRWYGISQTDLARDHVIAHNRIENIRYYHVEAKFTRNIRINNNIMTGVASNIRAIYNTYCDDRMEICRNTIKLYGNGYGMFLGFNDGTSLSRGLIANNVIYITGAASGTTYGIYASSGSNQLYYNNSVNIAAGGATGYAGYFQLTTAAYVNNEIKNNIFANSSTGCALFFHALPASCVSDYNLLYSTGTNVFERLAAYPNPTKIPTLEAWRRLTGKELHSLVYRPAFTAADNLVPNPADTAVWAINGRGIHLDSLEISSDKNGVLRPFTALSGVPDVGAYECRPSSLAPRCKPVPATLPATCATDTTQFFLFGEDTVASITWLANSPIATYTTIRQYVGEKPVAIGSATDYTFLYSKVEMKTNGTPLYDLNLACRSEWLGTSGPKNEVRATRLKMATPWTLAGNSKLDTIKWQLQVIGSRDTSYFLTGTSLQNPLPVSLLELTAEWVKDKVMVNWMTASEENTATMQVQRSTDGAHFTTVFETAAAGRSNTIRKYNVLDRTVEHENANVFYYRLKVTDIDGRHSYSRVVQLQRNDKMRPVSVYPNPFSRQVTVNVPEAINTTIFITITNIAGKQVLTSTQTTPSTDQLIVIPAEQLQQGVYFITIEYEGLKQTQKLIKQ